MRLSMKMAKQMGIHVPDGPRKGPGRPRKASGEKIDPGLKDALFLAACKAHGLPTPVPEYPFALEIGREWRFDWLFEGMAALEIEGGAFSNGAHVRGRHFISDMEKYNEAQLLGYVVLRCTPEQVESGEAFALVERCLKGACP